MTELLLGIDVGTSACKAAVIDARGVELAHGQVPTPWEPVATGAELDADTLLGAVADAAREALDRAPDGELAGIGVTSVAETGMLLDASGAVLHRPVAWHDSRGAAEAQALARDLPHFTQRTGLPASALSAGQAQAPRDQGRGALAQRGRVDRAPPGRPPGLRAVALVAHRPARSRARGALRRRPRLGRPARRRAR